MKTIDDRVLTRLFTEVEALELHLKQLGQCEVGPDRDNANIVQRHITAGKRAVESWITQRAVQRHRAESAERR